MKYIAYEWKGTISIVESDKVCFTPPGWHRPYNYSTLANMSNTLVHPAEKRTALVDLPGLRLQANNVRIVSPDICHQIDVITQQINDLRKQRKALYQDNFRTFALIKEGDVRTSGDKVFATKLEAVK